jgi:hypothetical protein
MAVFFSGKSTAIPLRQWIVKGAFFFARHANRLFIAWGGMQLAADLGEVLNSV